MKVGGGERGEKKKRRNEEIEATSRNEEKEAAATAVVERASRVFPEINQTAFKTEAEREEGRWGKKGGRRVGRTKGKREERLQPDFQPAGPCDIKYFRRPLSLLSPPLLPISRAPVFPSHGARASAQNPPRALKGNFTTQTFRSG